MGCLMEFYEQSTFVRRGELQKAPRSGPARGALPIYCLSCVMMCGKFQNCQTFIGPGPGFVDRRYTILLKTSLHVLQLSVVSILLRQIQGQKVELLIKEMTSFRH
jgi:hypothetical protein